MTEAECFAISQTARNNQAISPTWLSAIRPRVAQIAISTVRWPAWPSGASQNRKLGRTEFNHIPILKSNALGNSRSVNEQGRFRLVLGDDPLFPCVLQREVMRPNALGVDAVMAIIRLAKREGKTARLYMLLRCITVQPFDANLQKILESTTMRSPG